MWYAHYKVSWRRRHVFPYEYSYIDRLFGVYRKYISVGDVNTFVYQFQYFRKKKKIRNEWDNMFGN